MKTRFDFKVEAKCPVDAAADSYEVTLIRTGDDVLPVEEILNVAAHIGGDPIFQEDITRRLAERFGAKVTTVGTHSGVRVVCCSDDAEVL